MKCWIAGIGLLAPGLPSWAEGRTVLRGDAPWNAEAPFAAPSPAMLSATERRRTSTVVRLALAAAAEAVSGSGLAPDVLDTIFASSNGDGAVVGAILEALQAPVEVALSPTQFHNSVHNAAAGYWGIGAGSLRPSVSFGCFDDTFPMALLQAATRLAVNSAPVLLCTYDAPLPAPLHAARPTDLPFACALVLLPASTPGALAALDLDYSAEAAPAAEPAGAPEPLRAGNPAARALPLLRALALGTPAALRHPLLDGGHVAVAVTPC